MKSTAAHSRCLSHLLARPWQVGPGTTCMMGVVLQSTATAAASSFSSHTALLQNGVDQIAANYFRVVEGKAALQENVVSAQQGY